MLVQRATALTAGTQAVVALANAPAAWTGEGSHAPRAVLDQLRRLRETGQVAAAW